MGYRNFGYPADTGSAAIRRTTLPKRRRVRWLSAKSSQYYPACFTSRPLVFTNRCCKLVSDQLSVSLGSTNRRQGLPSL